MCTVVLRVAPGEPVLLLGVRDEFEQRRWRQPAAHWPGLPLVGGLDEQAGGTWLAVHAQQRRVACVLNGRGTPAPFNHRRSRGDLPLRAAADGQVHDLPVALYDPFHLVFASLSTAWLLSWDGERARTSALEPGTHLLTNAGHVYPEQDPDAKGAFFGPRFAAEPGAAEWLALADGAGLALDDERAIIVRRELPDGRVWGTSSVSFVELTDHASRYEFRIPGESWSQVAIGA